MPFTIPVRRKSAPSSLFHGLDLEAQVVSTSGEDNFRTPDLHRATSDPNPSSSSQRPNGYKEDSHGIASEALNDSTPSESEWKTWKLDDPYRTKVPEDGEAMEKWVKAMKESDDGMYQGWTDQIDTLIIFAGLFSATVTAFTIESYRWLEETQADMVARLQLRAMLNATHDPAIDRLAPATFHISPSSVLINTLWFASLTLALGAVVVSILCKQWLYEYQRYDNLTVKDTFLIRGLRNRGLKAWRVPEIIAFLPILLQTALVLFLAGLLILLGPLQPVVAAIITTIVGLIFLFMAVTTVLPFIQYIYPKFDTQCPYKSSQSWSFFVLSAFWLFDFSMFTTWLVFDRWEVSCVSDGTGLTLSRVYELLSNRIDAFQSIYAFLADVSLKPRMKADFTLLYDFVDGLDVSRRHGIFEAISQVTPTKKRSKTYRRVEQLKGYINQYYRMGPGQLQPEFGVFSGFKSGFRKQDIAISHTYHLRTQITLGEFLRHDIHFSDPAIINRYVEHWARCITDKSDDVDAGRRPVSDNVDICWAPEIGSHLVEMHSQLFKAGRASEETIRHISVVYSSLVESHQHHQYDPPPFTLLKDIQEWISLMPEIDLITKVDRAQYVLYRMVYKGKILNKHSHLSDLGKQSLMSFAQFFVEFFDRGDVSAEQRERFWTAEYTDQSLETLRKYLGQNHPICL